MHEMNTISLILIVLIFSLRPVGIRAAKITLNEHIFQFFQIKFNLWNLKSVCLMHLALSCPLTCQHVFRCVKVLKKCCLKLSKRVHLKVVFRMNHNIHPSGGGSSSSNSSSSSSSSSSSNSNSSNSNFIPNRKQCATLVHWKTWASVN